MKYMENISKRLDVGEIDNSFRSIIRCAINYNATGNEFSSRRARKKKKGCMSRYAIGDDYHKIIEKN